MYGRSPNILIGIPAYNEEATIADVVGAALGHGPVLVVDDGSTDLTSYRASRAGASILRFQRNAGKGAAVAALFAQAREARVDVLVLLDGDGQHDPAEIPLVAAPCLAGTADIVVGSRYHAIRSEIPLHRGLGQRFFNLITALATGVYCSDSQSGFRAFGPRAVAAMQLGEVSFSVESEQQFECRRHNLRLGEVPISCDYTAPEKRSAWRQGLIVLHRLAVMTWRRRLRGRFRRPPGPPLGAQTPPSPLSLGRD